MTVSVGLARKSSIASATFCLTTSTGSRSGKVVDEGWAYAKELSVYFVFVCFALYAFSAFIAGDCTFAS